MGAHTPKHHTLYLLYDKHYYCPHRKLHVAFLSAYIHFSLVNSKVNVKVMHIETANISKMVTDKTNTIIAIKYEVTCEPSISIFKFDLGLF